MENNHIQFIFEHITPRISDMELDQVTDCEGHRLSVRLQPLELRRRPVRPGVRLSLSPAAGIHVRTPGGEGDPGGHRLSGPCVTPGN